MSEKNEKPPIERVEIAETDRPAINYGAMLVIGVDLGEFPEIPESANPDD